MPAAMYAAGRAATPPATPLAADAACESAVGRPSSAPGSCRPGSPGEWGGLSPTTASPVYHEDRPLFFDADSPRYMGGVGDGALAWDDPEGLHAPHPPPGLPTSPPYSPFGPWSPVHPLDLEVHGPHPPGAVYPMPQPPAEVFHPMDHALHRVYAHAHAHALPGDLPPGILPPTPPPEALEDESPSGGSDADAAGPAWYPPELAHLSATWERWGALVTLQSDETAARAALVADAGGALAAAVHAALTAQRLVSLETHARGDVAAAWSAGLLSLSYHHDRRLRAIAAAVDARAGALRALIADEDATRAGIERDMMRLRGRLHLQAQRVVGCATDEQRRATQEAQKDAAAQRDALAKLEKRVKDRRRTEAVAAVKQSVEHLRTLEQVARGEIELRARTLRDNVALDFRQRVRKAAAAHARRAAAQQRLAVVAAEERGARNAITALQTERWGDMLRALRAAAKARQGKQKQQQQQHAANGGTQHTPTSNLAESLLFTEERLSRMDVEGKYTKWVGECWRMVCLGRLPLSPGRPMPLPHEAAGAGDGCPAALAPHGIVHALLRLEAAVAAGAGTTSTTAPAASTPAADARMAYRLNRSTLLAEHERHRAELRNLLTTQDRLMLTPATQQVNDQEGARRLEIAYAAYGGLVDLLETASSGLRASMGAQLATMRNRVATADRMYRQAMDISRRVPPQLQGVGGPPADDTAAAAGSIAHDEQVQRLVQQLNTALQDNRQMSVKIDKNQDELASLRKEVVRVREAERAVSYKTAELQELKRRQREQDAKERRWEVERQELVDKANAARAEMRKAEGVCAGLYESSLQRKEEAKAMAAAVTALAGMAWAHIRDGVHAGRRAIAREEAALRADMVLEHHVAKRRRKLCADDDDDDDITA